MKETDDWGNLNPMTKANGPVHADPEGKRFGFDAIKADDDWGDLKPND